MNITYQCWSCKKEYKAGDFEYKNGAKCDCGGYIVSPSGKVSMKVLKNDSVMDSVDKSVLYNATLEKMEEVLEEIEDKLGKKYCLQLLASLVGNYDLDTASNLVKNDCEPSINKATLADNRYSEGNEEAGYIDLSSVLGFVEEILNCDDSERDVEFQYFVRPETEEESKEEGHSRDILWFKEDDVAKIEDLQIQYEMR